MIIQTVNLVLVLSAVFGPTLLWGSAYDSLVLRGHPVFYRSPGSPGVGTGVSFPSANPLKRTRMPNGDSAEVFDGFTQYVEVPSNPAISVRPNGAITIEAWIRPDTLNFPSTESDGYVHWAGKGEPGQQEFALRLYSKVNSANRPNRTSGYAFNPEGGLGSGSYFQDVLRVNEWIHVALIIDNRASRGKVITIFKNGVLRKTTPLSQFDVVPEPGTAPLRIGTRDMRSFFKGAIGKFAVYGYALSESQLKKHFLYMQ